MLVFDLVSASAFIHSPLVTRSGEPLDADREELVVVSSPLFPHKLSKGYANLSAAAKAIVASPTAKGS